MYKINQSLNITSDLEEDLAITNRAVVTIETDYHGDIHLFECSRLVLHGDLYGSVNATGNSTVEYCGAIHNGTTAYGDSGCRFYTPLTMSAHIIGFKLDDFKKNVITHRKLENGELNPPLYPLCKTQ